MPEPTGFVRGARPARVGPSFRVAGRKGAGVWHRASLGGSLPDGMVGWRTPRLRLRRRDFGQAQRRGERLSSRYSLLLIRKRADGGPARLGITVTRKVGKAVRRNRVKRLVREWFRQDALEVGPYDLVVIAKRDIPDDLTTEELTRDFNQTLTRAGYRVGRSSSVESASTSS